jgi:hypothetical protein
LNDGGQLRMKILRPGKSIEAENAYFTRTAHIAFGQRPAPVLSSVPKINSHSEWGVGYSSNDRAYRGE